MNAARGAFTVKLMSFRSSGSTTGRRGLTWRNSRMSPLLRNILARSDYFTGLI